MGENSMSFILNRQTYRAKVLIVVWPKSWLIEQARVGFNTTDYYRFHINFIGVSNVNF
tara:strand:+ start:203 stop:376 length:174 start_codon:yes stop_codon:yes gene_type:complete